MSKITVNGLYVPLVTPMYFGKFDPVSMAKLMASVDEYVDGYVPCLSSGEGQILSDELWIEVVTFVRSQTTKPVFAGIKREQLPDTKTLAKQAAKLGCDGVIVPVPSNDWPVTKSYFTDLLAEFDLPVIIYNTETASITDLKNLHELDRCPQIVAIKDSSMNSEFFSALCASRKNHELNMSVLQGMEHQLDVPLGCDGYLISLLNIEPELVHQMWKIKSKSSNDLILKRFFEYNLGGTWYITLKALLHSREILRSAEEVKTFLPLPKPATT